MYLYFLDKLAQEQQGGFSIPVFESAIVQHDIHGRIERLSTFRDPAMIIEQALSDQSITTLVIVGADETFFELLPHAVEHSLALGFVPLQKRSALGTLLGMPTGIDCAQLLSRRLSRTIDIMQAHSGEQSHYLLGGMELPENAAVRMPETNGSQWSIRPKPHSNTTVRIENIGLIHSFGSRNTKARNYNDGIMDIVAVQSQVMKRFFSREESQQDSHFQATHVTIESRSASSNAIGDNGMLIPLPCEVRVLHHAITCIVGKESVLLES